MVHFKHHIKMRSSKNLLLQHFILEIIIKFIITMVKYFQVTITIKIVVIIIPSYFNFNWNSTKINYQDFNFIIAVMDNVVVNLNN